MKDVGYYDKLKDIPWYLQDCFKKQKHLNKMANLVIFLIISSALMKVALNKMGTINISKSMLSKILTISPILIAMIYLITLKTEPRKYSHFIENRGVSFVSKKHLTYLSSRLPVLDEYVLFFLVSTNVISFKNYIQYIVDEISSNGTAKNMIEQFVLKRLSNYGYYAYSDDGTISQDFVDSFIIHYTTTGIKLKDIDASKYNSYKKENKDFEKQLKEMLLEGRYAFRRKGAILLTTKKTNEIAADIMAYVNHLYSENKLETIEPYKTLFQKTES